MMTRMMKLRLQDLNVSISGMIFIVTGMIFTDYLLTKAKWTFLKTLFVHLSIQFLKILQNNWTILNQT